MEILLQSFFLNEAKGVIEGIVDLVLQKGTDVPLFYIFDSQGTDFLCFLKIQEHLGKPREITNEPFQKMKAVLGWDQIEELKEGIETNHGMRGVESELETRRSGFNKTGC